MILSALCAKKVMLNYLAAPLYSPPPLPFFFYTTELSLRYILTRFLLACHDCLALPLFFSRLHFILTETAKSYYSVQKENIFCIQYCVAHKHSIF